MPKSPKIDVVGSKILTKYPAGGGDEGELREEETEHGERTALLEDEPADQVGTKMQKRKQRNENEQYCRESEGELLDNSGMSISYCEGTAHSLPLVGSPRFLLVVVRLILILMSIIFDLLKLVLLPWP